MLGLLGFRSQNMDGRSGSRVPSAYFTALNPRDTSWTCPATGYYTFTLRGGGARGSTAGGQGASAAAAQYTALIFFGQVVLCAIGGGGPAQASGAGQDSTITMPSGKVITAGGGNDATPGVASGGDTNVDGLVSGIAPAIGNFPAALPSTTNKGAGPGTGGVTVTGPDFVSGGSGILYIQFGRP